MDTGGAVPIRNEKGEITMKKVKVQRYIAGKRPKYAPQYDNDYDDDDDQTSQQHDIQASTSQYAVNVVKAKKPSELEDRRLRRLLEREKSESYGEKERLARHREVMDPQVLVDEEELDDRMELDEDEEEEEEEEGEGRHRGIRRFEANEDEEEAELDEDERLRHRQLLKQKALEKQDEELLGVEEEQKPAESEESESEEEESEYEEESESEEEEMPRIKPVFVSKKDRITIQEKEVEMKKNKEIELENQRLHEENVKHTKKIIEDEIKREKQAEKEAEENILCDFETDEEDANDYEAWKLRELKRIKRDRDEREGIEKEKEEIARIRNMTDEERQKEFGANPKQIDNQKVNGKYKFLQKYYHRGAFFMDKDDEIYKRNFAEPTLEDHFDKTILPKVMQVKNFGMAGRTKYTHLVDQDTSKLDESPWAQETKYLDKGGGCKQVFDRPTVKKRK